MIFLQGEIWNLCCGVRLWVLTICLNVFPRTNRVFPFQVQWRQFKRIKTPGRWRHWTWKWKSYDWKKNPKVCAKFGCPSLKFCNVWVLKSGNLFLWLENLIIKTWKLFPLNVLHPMNFKFNTILSQSRYQGDPFSRQSRKFKSRGPLKGGRAKEKNLFDHEATHPNRRILLSSSWQTILLPLVPYLT